MEEILTAAQAYSKGVLWQARVWALIRKMGVYSRWMALGTNTYVDECRKNSYMNNVGMLYIFSVGGELLICPGFANNKNTATMTYEAPGFATGIKRFIEAVVDVCNVAGSVTT